MKVDNMGTTELQEQRAKNIIWNAAEDYSFLPDFEAFNTDGEADLYFNCIIGAVHRYYDYAPFQDLFLRMGRMPEAELFRSLLWLGLEQCVYHRAWKDRPALQELRTSYARRILQQSQSYWDQELFDRLRTAHFAKLLNENARLSKKVSTTLSTPLPLTHEGIRGFFFLVLYCKMFSCITRTFSNPFLLTTMNRFNISFIPEPPSWKISIA